MKMKLSRFNLCVENYPEQGENLLFNTRTQALIKINPELKGLLDSLEKLKVEDLGLITRGHLAALKENGIIVEDENEEEAKLKDFFRQLKYDSSFLPFEVTILTTYACNFRCVYCFEESVKEDVFLDKETSDLIIKWLIQRAEEKKFKRIFLVYYGGEPLLNIRPIYDISWHIREWAQKKGVEFGFGIITNGSLINPDLIDKFTTVGLKDIRITIDGDRSEHNKKRPFCDGRPTFDLIIDNIKSIIDKVKVGVVGNFDRENVASIPGFLDYLEKEGLLYRLDRIDFAPLSPRLGPRSNPGAIELAECLSFVSKDGLFNEVLAVKRELMRRGIKIRTGLAINACSLIMQDAAVTIDPEGLIYKCNSLVGYSEFSLGNVQSDEFEEKSREFLNIDAWDKCPMDCPYIPMCQGGCRFYSYLENNNFSDLSCKREYFDRITPELIKLEYHKLLSEKSSS
ncbi:MAG: SPASM domain-containing protein [Candidatus Omnitrophica bacterium]|nr:SPASM domain-containing protein [Candidatus Omnitrophota bacterium]